MKKRILITIFTVLLIGVLIALPVFAANATANVSQASAGKGETVTLTVTLASGVTVGSGAIEVSYDASVLELVKGEWNVSGAMITTFSGNKGAFAYTSGTAISGKVFTATFKVKDNAALGASSVKMTLQLKDGSNADISVTNNSGKVTVVCKHSYYGWSNKNDTTHARTCSACGNIETANHGFSNACDAKCDACGYTRTVTHAYKTTWSSDSSNHWHECSVCKIKKDSAVHTPGPAATEASPQTCTTCGHVLQEALGHTHKPTGEWLSDANSHWHACSACSEKADEAGHLYDNSCDETCNTCGYTRTVNHSYASEWSSDKDSHWHACTLCGKKDSVIAHTPGAEATEESPQICTVCLYELNPPKSHEHSFVGDYISDSEGHRKACSCGEFSANEAHAFDGGSVVKAPTEEVPGEKHYTCSTCGYVKKVEVEVAPEGTLPTPDPEKGDFSVLSLVIGIAIGAAVTAAVFLIVGKARKKKASSK